MPSFLRVHLPWLPYALCAVIALCSLQSCGDSDDEEKLQDTPADASNIVKMRAEKDRFLKEDSASPIPKEMRKAFGGLSYFSYDEKYAVIASFEAATKPDTLRMPASKGEQRVMVRVGEFSFSLGDDEKVYHLSGYRQADSESKTVLIPFKDKNTGTVCYEAGRYVDLEDPGDECTIDFNLAYNPYCAFNEAYSCLLIPPQNVLAVSINAGEKKYTAHSKGN